MPELKHYMGRPIIILNPGEKYPIRFGIKKAKVVADSRMMLSDFMDFIRKKINKNEFVKMYSEKNLMFQRKIILLDLTPDVSELKNKVRFNFDEVKIIMKCFKGIVDFAEGEE